MCVSRNESTAARKFLQSSNFLYLSLDLFPIVFYVLVDLKNEAKLFLHKLN